MTNVMTNILLGDIELSKTAAQVARRKYFAKGELEDLVASVAEHGVLQPIIVREQLRGAKYQLVAGERRYLAATQAELERIPAVVRDLTDEQVIEIQLIENLQRKDLHPMQEAEGYHELVKVHGHAVEELNDRVGKSRSYVYGRLKLLALCAKVRKAFYEDAISASVALLIARIPNDKLQLEALKSLSGHDGEPVSHRRAQQIVRDRYMLRLKDAKFPKDDPAINGKAGPCTTCPKRTGNQAELFADIQGADVCTDPVCFAAKTKAHGDQLLKAASAEGRPVIAGAAAKKLIVSDYSNSLRGFARLDEKNYSDQKSRTNRAIVGPDVEVTLVQLPKTGEVVEVVPEKVVTAIINKARGGSRRANESQAAANAKLKREKAYRKALFEAVRPLLPPPSMRQMAERILARLDNDREKVLVKVLQIDVPVTNRSYGGGYRNYGSALEKHLKALPDKALGAFVNDCLYIPELQVASYNISAKPARLEAIARELGINPKSVRASVASKKKGKKKTVTQARGAKRNTQTASNRKKPKRKKVAKKKATRKKARRKKKAA